MCPNKKLSIIKYTTNITQYPINISLLLLVYVVVYGFHHKMVDEKFVCNCITNILWFQLLQVGLVSVLYEVFDFYEYHHKMAKYKKQNNCVL